MRSMRTSGAWLAFSILLQVEAFEWHVDGRPEVNRKAIAGLWKLKPVVISRFPKEFTTSPRQPANEALPELLLMLKEDGSFHQYDQQTDVDSAWTSYQQKKKKGMDLTTGVWDFRDGRLILAADRKSQREGTLLEGAVVATYEQSLNDNPALAAQQPSNTTTQNMDTHLSVPQGDVKFGRFFYPKQHPAFFDQPMFRPERRGAFRLQQVLGNLNAQSQDEDELVECFVNQNFHNKTFMLTSHPLRQRLPKNREGRRQAEEQPTNIRVMQVRFFANNTFSTVAGLGESILRGKYDVIGAQKDQLWMRVSRFGFGRAVSGSVYSEGRMLTQDDCKTYWGEIRSEDGERLEVKGSVLFGSGLEPMPVGHFLMRELEQADSASVEDDEDDEDDIERQLDDKFGVQEDCADDGVDWEGDGFQ